MKKLLLATLSTVALGGFYTTQCLTLKPSNSNQQYDVTPLKNLLANKKVTYNDRHNTLSFTMSYAIPKGITLNSTVLAHYEIELERNAVALLNALDTLPSVIKTTAREHRTFIKTHDKKIQTRKYTISIKLKPGAYKAYKNNAAK